MDMGIGKRFTSWLGSTEQTRRLVQATTAVIILVGVGTVLCFRYESGPLSYVAIAGMIVCGAAFLLDLAIVLTLRLKTLIKRALTLIPIYMIVRLLFWPGHYANKDAAALRSSLGWLAVEAFFFAISAEVLSIGEPRLFRGRLCDISRSSVTRQEQNS
jgi:hypothetical protein